MKLLLSAVVVLVVAVSPAQADPRWERFELGAPAGALYVDPQAINDAGQIVGNYFTQDWRQRAFLLDEGELIDLGTLGGDFTYAHGINDLGEVVGDSATAFTNPRLCWEWDGETQCAAETHAFIWRDGVMRDIGTRGFDSSASGISDAGVIVGGAMTEDDRFLAARWWRDEVELLGAFGGCNSSVAMAVNALGLVTGSASAGGGNHAFLWEPRAGLFDLGTLGGPYSYAVAINDRGEVAVNADTPVELYCDEWDGGRSCVYEQRSFLWRAGRRTVLGDFGGPMTQASAVNARGQVAGTADTAETIWCDGDICVHLPHAFVWSDSEMIDLGEPGRWSAARSINDRGDVLGVSEIAPGDYKMVLWRRR